MKFVAKLGIVVLGIMALFCLVGAIINVIGFYMISVAQGVVATAVLLIVVIGLLWYVKESI